MSRDKKLVVAMVGLPAMGKSTVALKLKENLEREDVRVAVFNNGDVRRRMLPGNTAHAGFYNPENAETASLREKIAATNMAEVAFSVSKEWQKLGLSSIILEKLTLAARDNGIRGFEAFTAPSNQGMIKLFNRLPYKVRSTFDGDTMTLTARFDEPLN